MASHQWYNITLENYRKQKLAGLLCSNNKSDAPVLIVCHGFTGSKEGQGSALKMAEYFTKVNFNTFLFDFAGNGESEGEFEELTLSGQIDDLNCAVDQCREWSTGPIFTMGRSFGGTTVICHAAVDSRVKGVCTLAAAANLVELFTGFVDEDPDDPERLILPGDEGLLYLKKSFFDDLKKHDVLDAASKKGPRPLLLIHGTTDDVVPTEDAKLIYNSAPEPRELIYIEGANHQFEEHYMQVWDKCCKWLDNILRHHSSYNMNSG